MKKILFIVVCCLCLCGCGNTNKHYECKNYSIGDDFQMSVFKYFDCEGDNVIKDIGTTTTIYDSEDKAKYMHKMFSTLYSDVTINGTTVKYTSEETQEFIKKVGNCSQYLNYWKERDWTCNEKSAKN